MANTSRGGYALARIVSDLARRQVNAATRPISIGVVVDSRPLHLSVRLLGYEDPVEVTASDLFDLFPLETTDTVVVVPLPGGGWHVLDRLTGAEPEVRIGAGDIDASVVLAGAPFITDPQETAHVRLQGYRSDPIEIDPDTAETFTWTFEEPYDEVPFVIPTAQATTSAGSFVVASVGDVTVDSATLYLRNHGGSAVTARLVALATGVV